MISGKTNFHEIDTIRFLTISIIVWSHSLFPSWYSRNADLLHEQVIKSLVLQFGAISTIIFFIVSGILMRSKLHEYNLKKYFKERIPVVYGPWLFIIGLNVVLIVLHQYFDDKLQAENTSQFLRTFYAIVNGLIVYGPYWFVFTYLVGMLVLIYFKKYSSSIYLGLILGLFTAFYAMNFHIGWIDTLHTKAILAYTFFIWLGFQLHRQWKEFLLGVNIIGWPVLLIPMIIFYLLACYEGYSLALDGVRDPYASNRITNIIFSLVFFLVLLKLGPIRMINNLRPRKIVYGIYLINSIVIMELTVIFKEKIFKLIHVDIWTLLILQLIFFSGTLLITFFIVNYLIKSPLRWIIGSK